MSQQSSIFSQLEQKDSNHFSHYTSSNAIQIIKQLKQLDVTDPIKIQKFARKIQNIVGTLIKLIASSSSDQYENLLYKIEQCLKICPNNSLYRIIWVKIHQNVIKQRKFLKPSVTNVNKIQNQQSKSYSLIQSSFEFMGRCLRWMFNKRNTKVINKDNTNQPYICDKPKQNLSQSEFIQQQQQSFCILNKINSNAKSQPKKQKVSEYSQSQNHSWKETFISNNKQNNTEKRQKTE